MFMEPYILVYEYDTWLQTQFLNSWWWASDARNMYSFTIKFRA